MSLHPSLPTPLVTPEALIARLAAPDAAHPVLLLDCSFDLADTGAGQRAFEAARLPGAVYLHLDSDLSGPKNGLNGRHPLPARAALAERLAAVGATDAHTLVAYDRTGAMYAGRLWWLARWLGHERVTVLDGGLAAWQAAGGAVASGAAGTPAAAEPGSFTLRTPLVTTVGHEALRQGLGRPPRLIVDARSPDRFRGENETLDPVGGHIPGAANRFFKDNLGADGRFKPAAQLRAEWQALMAGRSPEALVMQCGSGVTACHNLLALAAADLDGATLYAGSWSEWCAQPGAPVAVG